MNIDIQDLKPIEFPDGTPHVVINPPGVPFVADVRARLRNPRDLWLLLSVVDAVRQADGKLGRLSIPYLMGGRYDREMNRGDAVDLRVVADCINSCGFEKVRVLDPHSDVVQLIRNVRPISNEFLVRPECPRDAVLIVPDAGAAKKAEKYRAWAYLSDAVQCIKARDSEGKITLRVLEPEKCAGKPCVVIDDLCDGGGTYAQIASQIKPSSLTLIVTHGIFSRGLAPLAAYDRIVTSTSFRNEIPWRLGEPQTVFVPSVI